MAEVEDVERILDEFVARFGDRNTALPAMTPPQRLIRASCPDLDLVRYARWDGGGLTILDEPPDQRIDIRISIRSDDLVRLDTGELSVGQAYLGGRLRIDASMSDLLRLRAAL